jgi:hypothetical protein
MFGAEIGFLCTIFMQHNCTHEMTKPQGQWTPEECAATAARQASDGEVRNDLI